MKRLLEYFRLLAFTVFTSKKAERWLLLGCLLVLVYLGIIIFYTLYK